jgi:hypothetical protein
MNTQHNERPPLPWLAYGFAWLALLVSVTFFLVWLLRKF